MQTSSLSSLANQKIIEDWIMSSLYRVFHLLKDWVTTFGWKDSNVYSAYVLYYSDIWPQKIIAIRGCHGLYILSSIWFYFFYWKLFTVAKYPRNVNIWLSLSSETCYPFEFSHCWMLNKLWVMGLVPSQSAVLVQETFRRGLFFMWL